ncbi:hypothetical protein RHMOL_Rhmol06G0085000 [Rhododendron molle]|uniref:Uncharacterized protein n=1 Tax=Rhododendron molle TaxID=49168 RepID=A0ACC0NA36_RHOML|nr:hypothetical protein RHMOL_Rhmol06G0085000 [Rhododendron molle]
MLAACSTDDAALSRPEVEKTKIDLRICCGDFRVLMRYRSIHYGRDMMFASSCKVTNQLIYFVWYNWPTGITDHGDWKVLVQRKPFFEEELESSCYYPFIRTKKAEEVKQSVDILVSFTAIDELNRALCSLPLCLLNCSLSMEGVVSFDHDIDVDKIGLSEVDDVQEQEEIM